MTYTVEILGKTGCIIGIQSYFFTFKSHTVTSYWEIGNKRIRETIKKSKSLYSLDYFIAMINRKIIKIIFA